MPKTIKIGNTYYVAVAKRKHKRRKVVRHTTRKATIKHSAERSSSRPVHSAGGGMIAPMHSVFRFG
jgi:hypothetical protein